MAKHRRPDNNGLPADRLPSTPPKLWDMQPGEPARWYARFEVYRSLGPHRSLMEAHRACAAIEGLVAKKSDSYWYEISRKWAWQARACAWDAVEREQLRANERDRRFDLREERLKLVDKTLHAVYDVIETADLHNMSPQEARDRLSTMRLFFRDMLDVQAREFGVPDEQVTQPEPQPYKLCAEDMRQMQIEFEAWQASEGLSYKSTGTHFPRVPPSDGARGSSAGPSPDTRGDPAVRRNGDQAWQTGAPSRPQASRPELAPEPAPAGAAPGHQTLLVCTGAESIHTVDAMALGAVKATTGLRFHRILAVTRPVLETWLRGEDARRQPVTLLHMAVSPAGDGAHFADGAVSGDWLRAQLSGVRVLLLAGCLSNDRPAWAGNVPFVVTVAEGLTPPDAAALMLYFWSAIGRDCTPAAALDDALAHCAPVVGEFVTRHW